MSGVVILLSIIIFLVFIYFIYTQQSDKAPSTIKYNKKIKNIKQDNDIHPLHASSITSSSSQPETCKISNQLGCKIVEGPNLYESIRDAVVMISVNQSWQGTGFFVTPDGYIVTAAHVISEPVNEADEKGAIKAAKDIFVLVSPNYEVYRCRVVGMDGTGDIGLLKIDMDDPFNVENKPIQNQKYLPFLDKASTGELAFVLGYPLGTDLSSFSMGIVRNERFVAPSLFIPFNVVLITSPAYQGNSGSPIVNVNGDVIGLLTFVYYANEQTFESIGGGPSSSIVAYVAKKLIDADKMKYNNQPVPAYFDEKTLKFKKGYLGFESSKVVWFSDIPILVDKYGFPFKHPVGFRGQISKSAPLSNIITSKDIIVRIDGKEIGALPNQTAPGDILWKKVPGDKVLIEYFPLEGGRYGELKSVEITLQDYPDKIDTFEGRALKVEMECIGDECSLAHMKASSDDFWLPQSSKPIGF
jgi:S1-C subfamily serine protease